MAFDRTNPAHLSALKLEVESDPIGMGYAAIIDQTTLLLKLLNEPENNIGGDTASAKLTPNLLAEACLADPVEFDGNQVNGRDILNGLIAREGFEDIEPLRILARDCFVQQSTIGAALDAQQAPLSRAEVLWGQDTSITKEDWYAARDS